MELRGKIIKEFGSVANGTTFKGNRLKKLIKIFRDTELLFFKWNKTSFLSIDQLNGRIVTADNGKKVCIWDLEQGKIKKMFRFTSNVYDVKFLNNQTLIVALDNGIWTLDITNSESKKITEISKNWNDFPFIHLSFDKKLLITDDNGNKISIYNIINNEYHEIHFEENIWTNWIALFKLTNFAALGQKGKISILSLENKCVVNEIDGLGDEIEAILIMKQDRYLVFSSSDLTISAWDLSEQRLVFKTEPAQRRIICLAETNSDLGFISGEMDAIYRNIENGEITKVFKGTSAHVTGLSITNDDKVLICSYIDFNVVLWDFEKVIELRSLNFLKDKLRKVVIFNNLESAAGLTFRSKLYMWNIHTGKILNTVSDDEIYDFSISPDSNTLLMLNLNQKLSAFNFFTHTTNILDLRIKGKIMVINPRPNLIILSDLNTIYLHSRYSDISIEIQSSYFKKSSITSICASKSNHYLITSSSNLSFQVYKIHPIPRAFD